MVYKPLAFVNTTVLQEPQSIMLFKDIHIFAFVFCFVVYVNGENQIQSFYKECFEKKFKLSCISEKTSKVIEDSIDSDLQLLPGLLLVRNDLPVEQSTGREINFGIDRLTSALSKFLNTHSLELDNGDNGEARRRRRRRRFGFFLTALLGTFGITGAMMLKGIAVIAGKALVVSKMALMIIGIVALKKMFSKDDGHEASVVQVHTLHDEHDKNLNAAMYNIRHI